jgi:prophage regulatory protein
MAHRILRLPAVIEKTGLSRSTVYARIAVRTFPGQIALGSPRSVGWIEAQIDDWIQQQIDTEIQCRIVDPVESVAASAVKNDDAPTGCAPSVTDGRRSR